MRAAQAEAVAIELHRELLDPDGWEELERQTEAVALMLDQQARARGEPAEWQTEDRADEQQARRVFGELFDALEMRLDGQTVPAVHFGWAGHRWELVAERYGTWRLTRLDLCEPGLRPSTTIRSWEVAHRLWVGLYRLQFPLLE